MGGGRDDTKAPASEPPRVINGLEVRRRRVGGALGREAFETRDMSSYFYPASLPVQLIYRFLLIAMEGPSRPRRTINPIRAYSL